MRLSLAHYQSVERSSRNVHITANTVLRNVVELQPTGRSCRDITRTRNARNLVGHAKPMGAGPSYLFTTKASTATDALRI
jgi:hypothetical protein